MEANKPLNIILLYENKNKYIVVVLKAAHFQARKQSNFRKKPNKVTVMMFFDMKR
jgi:hypothetical protein